MEDTQAFRDKITTVDEHGKRVWIYPKKPKGRLTNARNYVSYVLLAILFILPFIKYKGEPLILFNVLERNFIIFGMHFTPQDFHLFVLAMLTMMVFIVLFTVVFGRIFCGWICPQTIFMEHVFRKIEYWIEGDYTAQKRLDQAPWTTDKIYKKATKHFLFVCVSVLIAHTFLSYIVGVDEVFNIVDSSPVENFGSFSAMVIFTGVFYGVFAKMREQVCLAICPYGRLQGVLTDKNTILVTYDDVRGEPRGKIRKKRKPKPAPVGKSKSDCENPCAACRAGEPCKTDTLLSNIQNAATTLTANAPIAEKPLGDCIDCDLCVKVCPTGIDIRDGVQMECINCTACIDACNEVMDKINRPRGLIRYDSLNGIEKGERKIFTPRAIAYTIVLVVLLGVNFVLMGTRTDVETLLLRTPGMLFQEVDENTLSNLYNYQIFNKTSDDFPIEFKLVQPSEGVIRFVGDAPLAPANDMVKGAVFIELDKKVLTARKNPIVVEVYSNGTLIDEVETTFLGQ